MNYIDIGMGVVVCIGVMWVVASCLMISIEEIQKGSHGSRGLATILVISSLFLTWAVVNITMVLIEVL